MTGDDSCNPSSYFGHKVLLLDWSYMNSDDEGGAAGAPPSVVLLLNHIQEGNGLITAKTQRGELYENSQGEN